ncbi:hypothetical protein MBLNU230_g3824t1 [Neophaeotheca triangularis]
MMAVDSRQQAPPFQSLGYETMRYPQQPQFTNPWVSAPASQSQLYATSLPQDNKSQYSNAHMPNVSPAYSAGHVSASPMATGILTLDPELLEQSNLLYAQDVLHAPRPYGASYSAAPPQAHNAYPPTSAPQYASEVMQRQSPYNYQQPDRRGSHPSVDLNLLPAEQPMQGHEAAQQSTLIDFHHRLGGASESERASFSDALDASRGMVQMSQTDITPRNIYGSHQHSSRSSSDSYGFPAMHSSRSSISSTSTYPSYYPSSVSEASVGDYGSASESADLGGGSRTLPRPSGLIPGGHMPPAPSTMMGQFSSKVSSSSQKKHKCKICDKRFTRPSSLQTHMYSHTGEKPFACDVEGCGRHFSVVSNLRRHRKVHKNGGAEDESTQDHASAGEDEDE